MSRAIASLDLGRDLGAAPTVGQRGHDLVVVQADLGGQVGQDVRIADVAALGEVGPQEPLLHRPPGRPAARPATAPVGEEGVGPLRPVEVEVEPLLGRHRRDAVDELDGLVGPPNLRS